MNSMNYKTPLRIFVSASLLLASCQNAESSSPPPSCLSPSQVISSSKSKKLEWWTLHSHPYLKGDEADEKVGKIKVWKKSEVSLDIEGNALFAYCYYRDELNEEIILSTTILPTRKLDLSSWHISEQTATCSEALAVCKWD